MVRRAAKNRPRQGARLAELREAAGLSQSELARLIGESQQNVAYWELSDNPPRSDALPKLANVLGVTVETFLDLDDEPVRKSTGPVGRVRKVFEEVAQLPRSQQMRVVELVDALLEKYKKNAG